MNRLVSSKSLAGPDRACLPKCDLLLSSSPLLAQAYVVYGLMESHQGNLAGETHVLEASKSVFGSEYDFRQQREAVTAAYEQGELGEL